MKINKLLIIAGIGFVMPVAINGVSHTVFLKRFSKFGLFIPARGINDNGASGENNPMTIGPWEGSWKPSGGITGFNRYNQDTFNMDKPYNRLEWYEIDPVTGGKIRFCRVLLEQPVASSSNIYIGSNCSINVQEKQPDRWFSIDPISIQDVYCENLCQNYEIPGDNTPPGVPAKKPGMIKFRQRTGITGNDY